MSHTKGRLTFDEIEGWIRGEDKRVGTTCLTMSRDDDENRANARRLVACWNACEGMPTQMIEEGNALFTYPFLEAAGELLEVLDMVLNSRNIAERIEARSRAEAILTKYKENK